MSELQPQERDQESYAQKGGCSEYVEGFMNEGTPDSQVEVGHCVFGHRCAVARLRERGYTMRYPEYPCPAGN